MRRTFDNSVIAGMYSMVLAATPAYLICGKGSTAGFAYG
ncbi:hypothetical protein BamMC406_6229 [Burkholderia ambifaria MC40-6]|jgi:hypothetical protein|uniref:Uncharacterized protein n=1 Tax=Burkholderia ambifaria (strain MC40-6) TaxID=398577 RepID=B1Z4K0_BURA4|nr:hypothetical protein BamMC406_6229 [Burkholderia ambifaria MC40-6]